MKQISLPLQITEAFIDYRIKSQLSIDKINSNGVKAASDAELLSAFFGCTLDSAHHMITSFGGLRPILSGDQRLTQDQAKTAKVAMELMHRQLHERMQRGDMLEDPEAVRFYLSSQLRDRPSEVFCCVFLDNRHRVIEYEELFQGTINSASVHPREVVRSALRHNAAAVIFAHNHPSGVAEPSQSDERITQRLREALALIDVRVLDHFVIGDTVVSFAERGLL